MYRTIFAVVCILYLISGFLLFFQPRTKPQVWNLSQVYEMAMRRNERELARYPESFKCRFETGSSDALKLLKKRVLGPELPVSYRKLPRMTPWGMLRPFRGCIIIVAAVSKRAICNFSAKYILRLLKKLCCKKNKKKKCRYPLLARRRRYDLGLALNLLG